MLPVVSIITAQAESFHDNSITRVDRSFIEYCLDTTEVRSMIATDKNFGDVVGLEERAVMRPLPEVEVKHVSDIVRVSAP